MSRKERIVKHLKTNKELYLSFLIPFLTMLGLCVSRGIYPFGDQTFLHVDMYHQYCPFTMELADKLKSGESLLYSWELGLGSDFIGLFAYYLASPMNLLLLLWPKNFVIEFMTLMVIVKVSLCGVSFSYYLRKHFGARGLIVVPFSLLYALSAYTCAYNWNIMWMDGVWLAPLIVLGMEQLVREKKCGLYYVTLALSIFSNYYISIMICIFLVLYYVILMIEQKGKNFFAISARFAGYSLLAGGTSAVLLLPEIAAYFVSGSADSSFPQYTQWYFSAVDELARMCINVEPVPLTDHWPNLYCGCAVFLLFFLYVFNCEISWKKKIARVFLLAFFLVSFANNILSYIWHGMNFPDGLPSRETFLFIFLLLTVCFETVQKAAGNRGWHVFVSLLVGIGLLAVCGIYADKEKVTLTSVVMTGVLMLSYAIIYMFYIGADKSFRKMGCALAFLLVIAEAAVNLEATSFTVTGRDAYTRNLPKYEALLERLYDRDDDFYRIDKDVRLTKNDSAMSDFRSATIFSSLMNINVANWYRTVGMEGGLNYYCYNGATPLTSALLSVKYLFSESALEDSPVRTQIDEQDGMYLYENKYTLPLGFVVDDAFLAANDAGTDTTLEKQNQLARSLGASEPLFREIETEVNTNETIIHVREDSYVIGYYTNKNGYNSYSVKADYGFKTKEFVKCDHVYLLDLGWCTAGTDIKLTSQDLNVLYIQGEAINMESLNTAYRRLSAQTMEVKGFTDTSVEGHLDVKEPGSLLLTIPAEKGWSVFVNGEKCEPQKLSNAFICIPLKEGSYEISLKYRTPGLAAGALISLCCVGIFAVLMARKKKMKA